MTTQDKSWWDKKEKELIEYKARLIVRNLNYSINEVTTLFEECKTQHEKEMQEQDKLINNLIESKYKGMVKLDDVCKIIKRRWGYLNSIFGDDELIKEIKSLSTPQKGELGNVQYLVPLQPGAELGLSAENNQQKAQESNKLSSNGVIDESPSAGNYSQETGFKDVSGSSTANDNHDLGKLNQSPDPRKGKVGR